MIKEKLKNFFRKKTKTQKTKGQSLVEFTLTLPVLLILLSGLTEFGFMLNYYLSLVDASREVARTFSNFDPIANAATFYTSAGDAVILALEPQVAEDTSRKIDIDAANGDDIVVSAYSISGGSATLLDAPGGGEYHWSNNQVSRLPAAEIDSRLISTAPNTGVIVVEVFYHYDQVLGLPWLEMLPDPFLLPAYTSMPLSAAEPTATP